MREAAAVSELRQSTIEAEECWVAIEGELDGPTSQRLRTQVDALLEGGCRRMVIDLRDTTTIESPGFRVLVDALRGIEELGGALALLAPPGSVYEFAKVRRLGELLASVDEAIEESEAIRRLDQVVS